MTFFLTSYHKTLEISKLVDQLTGGSSVQNLEKIKSWEIKLAEFVHTHLFLGFTSFKFNEEDIHVFENPITPAGNLDHVYLKSHHR